MAKIDKKNTTVMVVGFVDLFDEDDPEAGIIISTDDGETYPVDLNKQGRRLLNLIAEKVRIQGTVTQTDDGENRISITKLEILDYEEAHEEDSYCEPDDYFDSYDN